MKILGNKYFKFGVVGFLYILWVIWLGNYWFLLGLPVIFDIYITKKVNWTPWKKRNQKNSTVVEWIDALIFAVLAVTFINIFFFQNYKIPTGSMEKSLMIGDFLYVSKLKYGPKIPNTPIAFPFTQNTMPITGSKSYLDWPHWGYKRLKGFSEIKNDENVVFNFPEGDTVCLENSAASYYGIVRAAAAQLKQEDIRQNKPLRSDNDYYSIGRLRVWQNYQIVSRPIDRRDNYIKRCVAIPGDTLKIVAGQLFINGKPQKKHKGIQSYYSVTTDGYITKGTLDELDIYYGEGAQDFLETGNGQYLINLTEENAEKLRRFTIVKSVEKIINFDQQADIFPHHPKYPWKQDDFGPLWIPKAGVTVPLNMENLCLYDRIINAYEGNKLDVKDSVIYINDKPANSYTFKMNYYWMMGDNRHGSSDSRYWGFVPEDHIVGAPKFIWLSLHPYKSFPANIRWSRLFTGAGE